MTPALGHTVLLCRNLAETRRFYVDVLGLSIEVDQPNWVSLKAGATLLSLRPRGGLPFIADGSVTSDGASVQLAFLVPLDTIETWMARFQAADIPILRGITDIASWRHRTIFVADPEGNIVEVYAEL